MQFYHRGTRLDRLVERIEFADTCWLWRGFVQANGYGKLGRDFAHRVAYEEAVGPIGPGLVIDHLCRNRACVNPDHLEAVTQLVNNRRGNGTAGRTHCRQGHALTPDNVYLVHSPDYIRRKCRTCQLANARRHRAKRSKEGGGQDRLDVANDLYGG